jgi:hypothetical protein
MIVSYEYSHRSFLPSLPPVHFALSRNGNDKVKCACRAGAQPSASKAVDPPSGTQQPFASRKIRRTQPVASRSFLPMHLFQMPYINRCCFYTTLIVSLAIPIRFVR